MQLLSDQAEAFLSSLVFWNPDESIRSMEVAGEGNMNAVFRVKTNQRTVIVKQSFSFVRKFPQIWAPENRIEIEYKFLKLVEQSLEIQHYSPRVLKYFPEDHLLILEDLGEGSDFSFLYQNKQKLSSNESADLILFLNHLHQIKVDSFPSNKEMRILNHEHIFNFPFDENNGFDLDQITLGLQAISLSFKQDHDLKVKIKALGERYLSDGDTLLHGDFYPGSWLKAKSGTKVIDPEFGFFGDKEFDLGVFMAHLLFSNFNEVEIESILFGYSHEFDQSLVKQYAGVELLRRIIGIAQLPLTLDLEQKEGLLRKGKSMILES